VKLKRRWSRSAGYKSVAVVAAVVVVVLLMADGCRMS
jgi:hypothetical protein